MSAWEYERNAMCVSVSSTPSTLDSLPGISSASSACSLTRLAELIAAQPDGAGGWHFAVVRHGRLASAGSAPRGVSPMPVVDVLTSSAQTVLPEPGPLHGAPAEEAGVLWRWLTTPGTRLVRASEPWTEPAASAGSWRGWLERAHVPRRR